MGLGREKQARRPLPSFLKRNLVNDTTCDVGSTFKQEGFEICVTIPRAYERGK